MVHIGQDTLKKIKNVKFGVHNKLEEMEKMTMTGPGREGFKLVCIDRVFGKVLAR